MERRSSAPSDSAARLALVPLHASVMRHRSGTLLEPVAHYWAGSAPGKHGQRAALGAGEGTEGRVLVLLIPGGADFDVATKYRADPEGTAPA